MAVTAFGDFPMASMLSPALTVVDQDPAALGRLAAERAVARLDGHLEGPAEHVTLPVRLLERSSCRTPEDLVELFPGRPRRRRARALGVPGGAEGVRPTVGRARSWAPLTRVSCPGSLLPRAMTSVS